MSRGHKKRFWTEREDAMMRELYPHLPTQVIAERLGRTVGQVYQHADFMGLKKTPEYLASPSACRLRRGDEVGKAYRFPKGNVPFNKGKKYGSAWVRGRMAETQFKKGQRPHTWKPIGTVLADTEGYLRRKIAEVPGGFGSKLGWEYVHQAAWSKAHGPIPPGHCVTFKDGNKKNCALENLELITRAENMRRNSVHRLPKELERVILLRGAIQRKINERERANGKKQNVRSA